MLKFLHLIKIIGCGYRFRYVAILCECVNSGTCFPEFDKAIFSNKNEI